MRFFRVSRLSRPGLPGFRGRPASRFSGGGSSGMPAGLRPKIPDHFAPLSFFSSRNPFFLFPAGKETPRVVTYLGAVLPSASIAMLVVYCFKNVSVFSGSHGLPELISAVFVIVVHKWRHNLLLSIVGGTVLYMLLVQRLLPF